MDDYRGTWFSETPEELNNMLSNPAQGFYHYDYTDHVSKINTDLGPVWLTGMRSEARFLKIQKEIQFDFVISVTDTFHVDLDKHGVHHIAYSVDDIEDPKEADKIRKMFVEFCPFVERCLKNGKKILIHCSAGVSRSPTAVIGYLIYRDHQRNLKAFLGDYLQYVKDCRRCIHPNLEFLKMLHCYCISNHE